MLTITLPGTECFNPATNEFYSKEGRVLHLEHSLYSVSKWESRWKKAFLSTRKTQEETLDYVRCMSEEPVDDETLARLTAEDWQTIERYLKDPMTATTFGKDNEPRRRKKTTSEEFYCMMAQFGIPFTCEHWNFNRLTTLLRVCAIRSSPKTIKGSEALKRQAALNEKRRQATGSKG